LVVKGLDESVLHMHLGDRYKLSFGNDLACKCFSKCPEQLNICMSYVVPNGKPSSAGKPRIAPGAEVEYEVSQDKLLSFYDLFDLLLCSRVCRWSWWSFPVKAMISLLT